MFYSVQLSGMLNSAETKQHTCSEKLDMCLGQLFVTPHLCMSPPCYTVELPSETHGPKCNSWLTGIVRTRGSIYERTVKVLCAVLKKQVCRVYPMVLSM